VEKSKLVIVVHYHELWLKGGNRNFFVGKLLLALRRFSWTHLITSTGAGYYFIKQPATRLSGEAGPAWIYERVHGGAFSCAL
jgi:hypothetical protein